MPLKNYLPLLFAITLSACSHSQLKSLESDLAAEQQSLLLTTQSFLLVAGMQHNQPPPSKQLRIYLEGDGHAWITPSQPSLDPTPRQNWFAKLALSDPQPAAWLARPCQYISNQNCHIKYWTDARFSQEVLEATSQAMDQLKLLHQSESLELIGYSGGATLALLLASQRNDIIAVQTLAGNLSPRLWTQQQKLTPLHQSLDPLDHIQVLKNIPQRHFVGSKDKVVPPALAEQWQNKLGKGHCSKTTLLPGVDHHSGWEDAWSKFRTQTPQCDGVLAN